MTSASHNHLITTIPATPHISHAEVVTGVPAFSGTEIRTGLDLLAQPRWDMPFHATGLSSIDAFTRKYEEELGIPKEALRSLFLFAYQAYAGTQPLVLAFLSRVIHAHQLLQAMRAEDRAEFMGQDSWSDALGMVRLGTEHGYTLGGAAPSITSLLSITACIEAGDLPTLTPIVMQELDVTPLTPRIFHAVLHALRAWRRAGKEGRAAILGALTGQLRADQAELAEAVNPEMLLALAVTKTHLEDENLALFAAYHALAIVRFSERHLGTLATADLLTSYDEVPAPSDELLRALISQPISMPPRARQTEVFDLTAVLYAVELFRPASKRRSQGSAAAVLVGGPSLVA